MVDFCVGDCVLVALFGGDGDVVGAGGGSSAPDIFVGLRTGVAGDHTGVGQRSGDVVRRAGAVDGQRQAGDVGGAEGVADRSAHVEDLAVDGCGDHVAARIGSVIDGEGVDADDRGGGEGDLGRLCLAVVVDTKADVALVGGDSSVTAWPAGTSTVLLSAGKVKVSLEPSDEAPLLVAMVVAPYFTAAVMFGLAGIVPDTMEK